VRSATESLRLGVLLLAAAVPYLNSLPNGFAFDDRGMIVENAVVRRESAPVLEAFTQPYHPGALYRPLTFLSYWLNHRTHGLTPFGFHLVNLLLHLVATLLVYRLALSLRVGRAAAWVAGLIFAVHPLHTEAVSSIVGRAELLSAIAVLGALLCAARSRRPGARRGAWLAGGAALFALGLLCKENAFVFLPLLLVAAWMTDRRGFRPALVGLNLSGELPLFLGVGVAYLALRWSLFGTLTVGEEISPLDNPLAHTSTPVRLGTALVLLVESLGQLVLPLHLSADYSYSQIPLVETPGDPRLALALAVLCALALLLWLTRSQATAAIGGALFFLGAFSLTANLLFPIGTIRGERLLYLPSVGFAVALGGLAATGLRRSPRATALLLAVVLLGYGVRTWTRNRDWASDATLFAATLETSPNSAKVHHNLGFLAAEEKRYRDAALSFRTALRIYPRYQEAAFGIGKMYHDRGMTAGALRWYRETLALDPRHLKAHLNIGVLHLNAGRLTAAEESFNHGLAIQPDDARMLTGLGFVRLAEGRFDEARARFEEARRIDPDVPDAGRGLDLALRRGDVAAQGS